MGDFVDAKRTDELKDEDNVLLEEGCDGHESGDEVITLPRKKNPTSGWEKVPVTTHQTVEQGALSLEYIGEDVLGNICKFLKYDDMFSLSLASTSFNQKVENFFDFDLTTIVADVSPNEHYDHDSNNIFGLGIPFCVCIGIAIFVLLVILGRVRLNILFVVISVGILATSFICKSSLLVTAISWKKVFLKPSHVRLVGKTKWLNFERKKIISYSEYYKNTSFRRSPNLEDNSSFEVIMFIGNLPDIHIVFKKQEHLDHFLTFCPRRSLSQF